MPTSSTRSSFSASTRRPERARVSAAAVQTVRRRVFPVDAVTRGDGMRTVWLLLLPAIVLTGPGLPHRLSAASAAAAAPVPECRPQSAGERPSATSDDIVNCIFARLRPGRVRLTVSYTYASSLGKTNIWLGVDVLAGGNRLKGLGPTLSAARARASGAADQVSAPASVALTPNALLVRELIRSVVPAIISIVLLIPSTVAALSRTRPARHPRW